ncbi:MAG: hypothetical protein COA67_07020 [Lutibacter sp.]|nr:MAG: hypothetical protein COA67_07020 [Lutibacter sp.]
MKSIIPVFLLMLLFSCSNDDETNTDRILPTPIIEFVAESNTVSHISDGSTYQDQVTVRLVNSQVYYFNESIEFTLRVDTQNSTAIEGVDFNFTSSSSYTFNNFNNFTQHIDIEILTEEMHTSTTKEITFIAQEVDSNIEVHGVFTINYECFVDLTGNYQVTNDFCLNNIFSSSITVNITKANNGKWHLTSADGLFLATCAQSIVLLNPGYIEVNCSNVPYSDDLFYYPNYDIGTVLGGTWNQETGILMMQHRNTSFSGGPYFWNSRYVRQ